MESSDKDSELEADNNWLPESVVNNLDREEDDSVSIITEVSREFSSPFDTTVEEQNEVNISEIETDLTRTQTDTNSTLNSKLGRSQYP